MKVKCESRVERTGPERQAGMSVDCQFYARYLVTVPVLETKFQLCLSHAKQAKRFNAAIKVTAL